MADPPVTYGSMATARISKGSNAPESDLTITPGYGGQFDLSGDGTFETDDERLVASLQGSVESGLLKVEYPTSEEDNRAAVEAEKERKSAARKRAREIEKGVPGPELTPVEGTPQGDPDDGAARDDQETGN